jgi:transposase-like protein
MSQVSGPAERTTCDHDRALQARQMREWLRLRGHLLTGADRALVAMYLEGGETIRRIATLASVTPSCVARRIRTITRRLADPTYPACLANRHGFNPLELRIIRDYFVRGLSIRRIRRHYNVSTHRVRAAIQKARDYTATAPHMPAPAQRKDSCL